MSIYVVKKGMGIFTMKNKKNIAVVGYGGMGGWHTRYIIDSDVATLSGIFDVKAERIALAKEKGIYTYSSFEAVLNDKNVDIIVIATPNELHNPLSIMALEAGKHVICEKPVTLSSKSLSEIIKASKKNNRLFTVHQNRRFDVDYLMIKQIYASGELGEVFGVESRIQGSRGIPGDWRGHKEHGGGMILDWGVHLIDQILGIINDKKLLKVYCRCDHITNYEVDDGFKLDMYFEDDVTARIEVGTSNFIAMPRFYMTGTNGSAIVAEWREKAKIVYCKNWEEKDVIPVITAAGLTKTMAPRDSKTITESIVERPESDVHDFYRNFVKAVDGETTQLVTHEQLMRVMKIMESAFLSDETGTVIEINDILTPDKI